MKDDFSKYESMKDAGFSAEAVYRQALKDGIDNISRIRLIRKVFSLSLGEAKEVLVRAEGLAESLDDHQQKLVKDIAEAREELRAGKCQARTPEEIMREITS